jgi:hypothetical protein
VGFLTYGSTLLRFYALIFSGCPTLPDFWEGWA